MMCLISNDPDMALDDPVNVAKADTSESFEGPSFRKTLRNLASLELPASFVRQHGRNFQAKVVVLGPSGRPVLVHLNVDMSPIQDRVHFRGCEWGEFLVGNGFKVGHDLLISLVSYSIFTVRHSGVAVLQESMDKKRSTSKIKSGANLQESNAERLVEAPVINKPCAPQTKSEVVYARNNSWNSNHVRSVEILVGNLQCPHFVLRIKKSHLREWKSCSLSVPRDFYKKYASYFCDGANVFQGPNGRMMNLRFSENSLRFTSGWKAFHRDNGINFGDVVLFSLCEPARWLVQFVERRKLEKVAAELECDHSS